MKLKHFLLTALLLFTGVSGVYATRHYVGFASGNTDGDDLSTALGVATTGDTVFVAAGLYLADAAEFTVKQNVTLIGGYAKGDIGATTRRYPGQFVPFDSANLSNTTKFTVLDGNSYKRSLASQKHRVVTVQKDGVVDGCLIRNGHVRNDHGGGVLLDGGKLYNSIVRGNVAMSKPDTIESLGGGVFIKNDGELINCLVAYNMANDGYGVAAGQGGGKMINNTITANTYSPVFAKIKGGTFKMYAGTNGSNSFTYRNPALTNNGEIPKWTQNITLSEFYISRIQTTQGQYAVFCAAMDIPKTGNFGKLNATTLQGLIDPIKVEPTTVGSRYGFSNTGQIDMLQHTTNANYAGLAYDAGVWHPVIDTATVEYPMGTLTWFGSLAYSVWLGGGLPTEAQWQFAARCNADGATVNDNLYSGAYGTTAPKDTVTWRILDTIAWVNASVSIDTTAGRFGQLGATWTTRPHEVARKRPNDIGLYDMTGNIFEMCGDWFNGTEATMPYTYYSDPMYNTPVTYRVIRGGYFESDTREQLALPGRQFMMGPTSPSYGQGFRPVVAF